MLRMINGKLRRPRDGASDYSNHQSPVLSHHPSNSPALERRWKLLMIKSQGGCRVSYKRLLVEIDALLGDALPARLQPTAADEARISVLRAVHDKRCTYSPRQSFYGWLEAITAYKIRDHIDCEPDDVITPQRHEGPACYMAAQS